MRAISWCDVSSRLRALRGVLMEPENATQSRRISAASIKNRKTGLRLGREQRMQRFVRVLERANIILHT